MADRSGSRGFYERQAAAYDRRWRRYQAATHEALLAHLEGRYRRVLDAGCGTGTLLLRLLERHPDAEGIGLDTSGGMLDIARRKLAGRRARLYRADARRIPLPRDRVDLLTLASVLHYLRRPSAALGEAYRVLRPGGTLAIVDYVTRAGTGSLLDGLIRLYDPGHVRCRDARELGACTAAAGFRITHVGQFPIDGIFRGVLIVARAPGAP